MLQEYIKYSHTGARNEKRKISGSERLSFSVQITHLAIAPLGFEPRSPDFFDKTFDALPPKSSMIGRYIPQKYLFKKHFSTGLLIIIAYFLRFSANI